MSILTQIRQEASYMVAQHTFTINLSADTSITSLFPSIGPFAIHTKKETEPLFTFILTNRIPASQQGSLLTRFEWEETLCSIYTFAGGYEVEILPEDHTVPYRMVINRELTRATTEVKGDTPTDSYVVNNFLMMLYTFATAPHHTLMFHASVIEKGEEAFLFLGKSGTGKSTHSSLWLQHIPGSRLLNDDNPIVRIYPNGEAWVYGSPWSGKTPCYLNRSARIGAFTRLKQAPHNRIKQETTVRSFASLLPSCSCLRQEKHLFDAVCDTVSQLATTVPVYELECLPDGEAAKLCYSVVTQK